MAGTALVATGGAGRYLADRLNRVGRHPAAALAELRGAASTPLFDLHPALAAAVPWRPLASCPTPVQPLPSPAGAADVELYVKRDDLCSPLYGGNKIRKLEHFLAAADLAGATSLVTIGALGSNHGLATALHGQELGFDVKLALFAQPVTQFVLANVRALAAARAQVSYHRSELGAVRGARAFYEAALATDRTPYFIMVGGSSRLGTTGYVNAALEFAAQVRRGELAEPSRIFVALGSGGTAAGLAAGCGLAGLRTRVTAVRIARPLVSNAFTVRYLANDVLSWLCEIDPSVRRVRIGFRDFDVIGDQLGSGYGHPTPAGDQAAAWVATALDLEPTYTAKALAACLDYCRRRARPGERVLFWNTFNSAALPPPASLETLPASLRSLTAAE
jgi:D-cysteine desulfhydrase